MHLSHACVNPRMVSTVAEQLIRVSNTTTLQALLPQHAITLPGLTLICTERGHFAQHADMHFLPTDHKVV